jgi:hypothetical protein
MAWLNSDDLSPTWALHTVAAIFNDLPEVDWITSIRPLIWNQNGLAVDNLALLGYSKQAFMNGEHLPECNGLTLEVIQQESTFWRRSLWESAGATLDTTLQFASDFDLWARFYQHSDLIGVRTPLGGFRRHGDQLSLQNQAAYYQEAVISLEKYGGRLQPFWRGLLRRYLAPLFRHRLRKMGAALTICYPTKIAVYNLDKQRWQLRTAYV